MDRLLAGLAGRLLSVAVATSLVLAAGCVATESFHIPDLGDESTAPVCRIEAWWENKVMYAADPANRGAPTPGLAGRVYLHGEQVGKPLRADGTMIVDLHAVLPERQDGQLVHLERWNLDKDTLRRLLRQDIIGWGYTLFLPWGTYRPNITQVQLKLQWTPPKGIPLYADNKPMVLSTTTDPVPVVTTRQEILQPVVPLPTRGAAPPALPAATMPPAAQPWHSAPVVAPNPAPMAYPAMPPMNPAAATVPMTPPTEAGGARVIYPPVRQEYAPPTGVAPPAPTMPPAPMTHPMMPPVAPPTPDGGGRVIYPALQQGYAPPITPPVMPHQGMAPPAAAPPGFMPAGFTNPAPTLNLGAANGGAPTHPGPRGRTGGSFYSGR